MARMLRWGMVVVVLTGVGLLPGADPEPARQATRRTRDVIYGRQDGLALTLDVFSPPKPNGAGVVAVVSAGFSSKPEDISPVYAEVLLKRGYTVFAVVHGSQPRFTVPEIRDHVYRAVRFVRHHAKDYGVDPDRLGAAGASSGGLMALLAGHAGKPGDPKAPDPVDRESSRVRAVACFFPPTDYLNYGKAGNELLDVKVHPASFRAAYDYHEFDAKEGLFSRVTDKDKLRAIKREVSPIYHVTKDSAATLLIHGDKDELVPLQQSEVLAAKLKEVGVPHELVVKKDAGHGWLTMVLDLPTLADWFDEHLAKK